MRHSSVKATCVRHIAFGTQTISKKIVRIIELDIVCLAKCYIPINHFNSECMRDMRYLAIVSRKIECACNGCLEQNRIQWPTTCLNICILEQRASIVYSNEYIKISTVDGNELCCIHLAALQPIIHVRCFDTDNRSEGNSINQPLPSTSMYGYVTWNSSKDNTPRMEFDVNR